MNRLIASREAAKELVELSAVDDAATKKLRFVTEEQVRLKFVSSQLPNFSCKAARTECLKGFEHSSVATFMVSPS